MKLLDKESQILGTVELQANSSVDKIQKLTGFRQHSIRYCLRKLIDQRLIRYTPYVNLMALGYTDYNIYFSLTSSATISRKKALSVIAKTKNVTRVSEMGGEFQYVITILSTSFSELEGILSNVMSQIGEVVIDKVVSARFSYTLYPRKYLSSKAYKIPPLKTKVSPQIIKIDALDSKIISALAMSNFESHRQIAQRLAIPLSTMELRIKELEKRNIIGGYIFEIDTSKLDVQHFKLLIFSKGMSATLRAGLELFAAESPYAVYFATCFGSWDFELGIEVKDSREVVSIVNELQDQYAQYIDHITVLQKFRDLKSFTYPLDMVEHLPA